MGPGSGSRHPAARDGVDGVGRAVAYAVDDFDLDARRLERIGGPRGGHHPEALTDQATNGFGETRAIGLPSGDQHATAFGQGVARLDLGLRKGSPKIRIDPHHLSGALHFGAQQRIDTRELDEGEYRLFH